MTDSFSQEQIDAMDRMIGEPVIMVAPGKPAKVVTGKLVGFGADEETGGLIPVCQADLLDEEVATICVPYNESVYDALRAQGSAGVAWLSALVTDIGLMRLLSLPGKKA